MSAKEAFGLNLRRARIKKGRSLDAIAKETRIAVEHLQALEENDFTYWPNGIYARAWVRAYAECIGVDPQTAVDDFCRWFPNGDRRADRMLKEAATLIGHELEPRDDLGGIERDRRTGAAAPPPAGPLAWVGRLVARLVPSRRPQSQQDSALRAS